MADIKFPQVNTKVVRFPVKSEILGAYPVFSSNVIIPTGFAIGGSNTEYFKWGNFNQVWVGKDKSEVEFWLYNYNGPQENAPANYEMQSLAFEDGRKNFNDVYVRYGQENSSNHRFIIDSSDSVSDITSFPVVITKSLRLAEGMTTFPQFRLSYTFDSETDMDSDPEARIIRVVIPSTITEFTIQGMDMLSDTFEGNNMLILGVGASFSKSLNEFNDGKNIVEIYCLKHTELPAINFEGNINCTVKLYIPEALYTSGMGTETRVVIPVSTRQQTDLEAMVNDKVADVSLATLSNPEIDDIFSAPQIEFLNYNDADDDNNNWDSIWFTIANGTLTNIKGFLKVTDFDSGEISHVYFNGQESPVTAYPCTVTYDEAGVPEVDGDPGTADGAVEITDMQAPDWTQPWPQYGTVTVTYKNATVTSNKVHWHATETK